MTSPATSGSISKQVWKSELSAPNVTMYAPYVQDTWRVKDNLTLSLGLRYEYWGTPANVLQFPAIDYKLGLGFPARFSRTVFSLPQQPDRNNFAPRLGIAYTPQWGKWLFGDQKTVIRAGYGVFYDGLFTNITDNTAASAPNATGGNITGGARIAGRRTPLEQLSAVTPTRSDSTTIRRWRTIWSIPSRSSGTSTSSANCRENDSYGVLRRHPGHESLREPGFQPDGGLWMKALTPEFMAEVNEMRSNARPVLVQRRTDSNSNALLAPV